MKEKDKEKEATFEESLKRLEKIAQELESDDISLDASLKRYEEGMKLVSVCLKKLEEAKKKVEFLTKKDNGRFELTDAGEPEKEP